MRAKQKPVEENGGELTTLEALKEANQQLRLASDQLHAILDQACSWPDWNSTGRWCT